MLPTQLVAWCLAQALEAAALVLAFTSVVLALFQLRATQYLSMALHKNARKLLIYNAAQSTQKRLGTLSV
jgi:hypothetical protein